jgi:hypothetical protein
MHGRVMTAGLAAALLALAGCAAFSGGDRTGAQVSADEVTATLPPEQRAQITEAENALREAEQQAVRAEEAVKLAEGRTRMSRADVDARKAAVERAQAQADLVKKQHQAQLSGTPGSGQAPADVQAAQNQVADAQHAVEVARWEHDRAQAMAQLRRDEQAYAESFLKTARELVEARRAEVDLAKAQVASQATPDAVPGVANPNVARAQAKMREEQAGLARARAEATERLSRVQLGQRGMAKWQSGPPQRTSAGAPGRSGAAQLTAEPRRVEPEPLPWPAPWEQGQAAGGQTPGPSGTPAPASGAGTRSPATQQ